MPAEMHEVQMHLKTCKHCQTINAEMGLLKEVTSEIRSVSTQGKVPETKDIVGAVFCNTNRQIVQFRQPTLFKRIVVVAASLLLGMFIYQQFEIKKDLNDFAKWMEVQNAKPTIEGATNHIQVTKQLPDNPEDMNRILEILQNSYPDVYEKIKIELKHQEQSIQL